MNTYSEYILKVLLTTLGVLYRLLRDKCVKLSYKRYLNISIYRYPWNATKKQSSHDHYRVIVDKNVRRFTEFNRNWSCIDRLEFVCVFVRTLYWWNGGPSGRFNEKIEWCTVEKLIKHIAGFVKSTPTLL